jgi:hypothetical protein
MRFRAWVEDVDLAQAVTPSPDRSRARDLDRARAMHLNRALGGAPELAEGPSPGEVSSTWRRISSDPEFASAILEFLSYVFGLGPAAVWHGVLRFAFFPTVPH